MKRGDRDDNWSCHIPRKFLEALKGQYLLSRQYSGILMGSTRSGKKRLQRGMWGEDADVGSKASVLSRWLRW